MLVLSRIVKRDKNDEKIIKKITLDGSAICAACHGLAFNRDVNNIPSNASTGDW